MNSSGQPLAVYGTIILVIFVSLLRCSDSKSTARPSLCQYHASSGDCSFFHCLDVKLSCLRQTFAHRLAHKFCHRMHAHFDEFTPEGKHWADRTNKCVMRQLAKETASMDACRDVSSLVRQAFHTCAAKEDICSALWDNRQPLLDIMTEKSWLSIVQAAKHCPRRMVNRYIFWTLDNLNV